MATEVGRSNEQTRQRYRHTALVRVLCRISHLSFFRELVRQHATDHTQLRHRNAQEGHTPALVLLALQVGRRDEVICVYVMRSV
jgi:hypothetical protein